VKITDFCYIVPCCRNNPTFQRCMEEHGQRVSEYRVLRRIFGPKRDEATG
jgi:hypothetical protein